MTIMPSWIKIEYAPKLERAKKGNKIGAHLVPSPYDVPAAVRVHCTTREVVSIEFKYIDRVEHKNIRVFLTPYAPSI